MYDEISQKWWFSAVDICGILIDENYDTARKYWKTFRGELYQRGNQLVRDSYQLKFPASDGKYYFTEVLDIREVAYLIQIIPSPKAETYRLWLAGVVADSTNLETILAGAGAKTAGEIVENRKATGEPYVLQMVTREEIG